MDNNGTVLIIVDMQKYYLHADSPYARYAESIIPGCLDYLMTRCRDIVVPNIRRLLDHFREAGRPVIFLRLCSTREDRRDLHRFFRETHEWGKSAGYDGVYPLAWEPWAEVIDELGPLPSETVIDKTTFSPFTSSRILEHLRQTGARRLVFTGLATSQCVETTARDASDHGYDIVHVEDAQADYDESTHRASLFSSRGVCGGVVVSTAAYLA